MSAPPEKAIGYTVSVAVVMLLVWLVLSVVIYFVTTATGLSPGVGAFLHHPVSTTTTTSSFTTSN